MISKYIFKIIIIICSLFIIYNVLNTYSINNNIKNNNIINDISTENIINNQDNELNNISFIDNTVSNVRQNNTITSRSEENREEEYIKFIATAYCGCEKCCGKSDGITAMGTLAKANYTVAMSSTYKLGTKLLIKNSKGILLNNGNYYVVEDRGGAINGNRIDIFFDSHQQALNFGKQTVYIKIIK